MSARNHAAIAALKTAQVAEAVALPIHAASGDRIGRLVPLTASLCRESAIVADLFRWRSQAITRFLTVFEPTLEKTQGYLDGLVLVDPARILFLVVDADGQRIGNIGLCSVTDDEAEVDNVIRGERALPHFMDAAQRAILRFAFDSLGVHTVFLRVLADNKPAIDSYLRLGYRVTSSQPLRREDTSDGYRWVADDAAADSATRLLRMEINR